MPRGGTTFFKSKKTECRSTDMKISNEINENEELEMK